MKKILLATIMLLFVVNISAQDSLQVVVQDNIDKLVSLTKNDVKETGNEVIDGYTKALYDLTEDVVDNGEDLNSLVEGVKNGTTSKISALVKASSLSTKISETYSKAEDMYSKAKEAASQIKSLKGLSLKTLATQILSNNTLITKLLGDETINQIQTMASLISQLK